MKLIVFTVLGSPRKTGNTAALLGHFTEGLIDGHPDVKISSVFLQQENISPCRGCDSCKNGAEKVCVVNDDMQKYYGAVNEADLIVLATPVYWFAMSAQMKAFIDRLYALDFPNFPAGKKLVLLTSYGDTDARTSGAVNISNGLKQTAELLRMKFVIDYGASSASPISENKKVLAEVFGLGKNL